MSKDFDMGGALFVNDKGGVDKRPDFRGDITINGVKYRLSAWKRQYQKGEFLSLAVEEFEKVNVD